MMKLMGSKYKENRLDYRIKVLLTLLPEPQYGRATHSIGITSKKW